MYNVLIVVVNIIIRLLRNIRILGIIFIGLKKRVHTKESISIIQLKLLLILRKKKNIQITSNQLNNVSILFDEINHILSLINENQNRKRIVFIIVIRPHWLRCEFLAELPLSQRFGHPRVLGIPIRKSLAFWASPLGDAQNADRFDFA